MTTYPKLACIVAKSRNGVIGIDGDLPWKLSSDLKFFKKATLGKPVLMGRVTWESLPFALPGRPNLVLTRQTGYVARGAEIYRTVEDLVGRGFELAGELNVDEVMIIGGANLYRQLLPQIDRIYLTEVHADIAGDAYFPNLTPREWELTEQIEIPQGPKDDYPFSIEVLNRVNSEQP